MNEPSPGSAHDLAVATEPAVTPAGGRLLDSASALFYERGIHAVGVDLIAEQAGTTKKTLYDRFGSKDALVAAYLQRRTARWQTFVLDRLNRCPPGADRVPAVFDALAEWHADNDRGCAFVNAYAEVGGTDHPAVPVIRADKHWMRALFRHHAAEAGVRDPDGVGDVLHLLYEGALVAATVGGQDDAIGTARAAASALVSS